MSETPLRSLVVVPRSHVDGTTDALLARRPLSERELAYIYHGGALRTPEENHEYMTLLCNNQTTTLSQP